MNKLLKKVIKFILITVILLLIIFLVFCVCLIIKEKSKTVYYAKDFGIEVIKSKNDKNNNGIDDYTDILLGAKKDAENKPQYISKYYARWVST